jgi:hypothetical protein
MDRNFELLGASSTSVESVSMVGPSTALANQWFWAVVTFVAARAAWWHLFDRSRSGRGVRLDDDAAPDA